MLLLKLLSHSSKIGYGLKKAMGWMGILASARTRRQTRTRALCAATPRSRQGDRRRSASTPRRAAAAAARIRCAASRPRNQAGVWEAAHVHDSCSLPFKHQTSCFVKTQTAAVPADCASSARRWPRQTRRSAASAAPDQSSRSRASRSCEASGRSGCCTGPGSAAR